MCPTGLPPYWIHWIIMAFAALLISASLHRLWVLRGYKKRLKEQEARIYASIDKIDAEWAQVRQLSKGIQEHYLEIGLDLPQGTRLQ